MTISNVKQWGMQKMGNLKPGATYIYERNKGTVYARELGADPATRQAIGWEYKKPYQHDFIETQLWQDIVETGKANPALQKALDRAKLLYQTIKDKNE
jgi:hypothetical protein